MVSEGHIKGRMCDGRLRSGHKPIKPVQFFATQFAVSFVFIMGRGGEGKERDSSVHCALPLIGLFIHFIYGAWTDGGVGPFVSVPDPS